MLARAWQPEEVDVLRRHYEKLGAIATAALLPGRTLTAVQIHARRLGLKSIPRWSRADDLHLEAMWDEGARIGWIARRLGRSRRAVRARATQLKLGSYAPEGFETLLHAAQRVGYNTVGQMRRVLDWAGVRTHVSRSHFAVRKWRCHFVNCEEVDAAMAAWLRTETVAEAARRHGVSHATVMRRLGRADVTKGRAKFSYWRLDPAVVDRVMGGRTK
jgi:hypothetical protein